MKDVHAVIKAPLITEKANILKDDLGKVAFVVAKDASKYDVKEAVERLFKVKVRKVNISNVRGKPRRLGRNVGRRPDWKKAVVTLRAGDRIDFFEGA
jgi:large subunit ribosomal protein L23